METIALTATKKWLRQDRILTISDTTVSMESSYQDPNGSGANTHTHWQIGYADITEMTLYLNHHGKIKAITIKGSGSPKYISGFNDIETLAEAVRARVEKTLIRESSYTANASKIILKTALKALCVVFLLIAAITTVYFLFT